jgi:hypothetical protein
LPAGKFHERTVALTHVEKSDAQAIVGSVIPPTGDGIPGYGDEKE